MNNSKAIILVPEVIEGEVMPDMEELLDRAKYAGEAWGSLDVEAGHKLSELTPGNLLKRKSEVLHEIGIARADLTDEEHDKIATQFMDSFGKEYLKSTRS